MNRAPVESVTTVSSNDPSPESFLKANKDHVAESTEGMASHCLAHKWNEGQGDIRVDHALESSSSIGWNRDRIDRCSRSKMARAQAEDHSVSKIPEPLVWRLLYSLLR